MSRYYILLSWHHGAFWARVYDNYELADQVARGALNCVMIAVTESERDFRTYVDMRDYEYEDADGNPMPVDWQNTQAYGPETVSPVVRVGRDISRRKFKEMEEDDESSSA